MYWGSRGLSSKIEQANMDGSNRATLVSSGLKWVNSLAIDYRSRLLYWCDAYLTRIERIDLQGNNRKLILDLSLDLHPFGLALHSNILYWSDWNSRSIHKYNMTSSVTEVVVRGMGTLMELHIYDHTETFNGTHVQFSSLKLFVCLFVCCCSYGDWRGSRQPLITADGESRNLKRALGTN